MAKAQLYPPFPARNRGKNYHKEYANGPCRYFQEGRLVGYIDSQVQSYLLITNPNLRETLFTIKHPKSPETYISLEIMRGEAKRK